MLLKWTIPVLSICLTLGSCRGKSGRDTELLTHSPWKYEQAGFNTDANDDGDDDPHFNALDPRIMGFVKDYTVVFRSDSTGALRETRVESKHPTPDSLPFFWSFQNNDSLLYFQDQYYRIQTLTNDRLIIYADHKLGDDNSRYTIILKH